MKRSMIGAAVVVAATAIQMAPAAAATSPAATSRPAAAPTVAVLNTRTLRVTSRIRVGTEPIGLAIDRARHTTYVSNFQDDTVSFFRTP